MKSKPLPTEWVERIFMRMHGRFGNQFLDKFRIGQVNAAGEDLGVLNAKQVWAEQLGHLSVERLKKGLDARFSYPPSCDDFEMACRPVPEMHKDKKALPAPTRSKEETSGFLKKMHAVFERNRA
jgi:hypothetical protein